jgi:hypothetical protein
MLPPSAMSESGTFRTLASALGMSANRGKADFVTEGAHFRV